MRRSLAVLAVLVALLAVGVALPGVGGSQVAQGTGGFGSRQPLVAAPAYPPPPRILQPGQHAYSSTFRVEAAPGRFEFVRIDYLLYAPAGYAPHAGRRWPLILFLHALGERGHDPWLLTAQPLPKTLAHLRTFPAPSRRPSRATSRATSQGERADDDDGAGNDMPLTTLLESLLVLGAC